MRVSRGIARSLAIACATLAVAGATSLAVILLSCPRHRAAVARLDGRAAVVLDSGYRFARASEWIYTCMTPHAIGGLVVHDDLGCYCAPAGSDPAALGAALAGACEVERTRPSRLDDSGACRHAHCEDDDLAGLVPIVPRAPAAGTPRR